MWVWFVLVMECGCFGCLEEVCFWCCDFYNFGGCYLICMLCLVSYFVVLRLRFYDCVGLLNDNLEI